MEQREKKISAFGLMLPAIAIKIFGLFSVASTTLFAGQVLGGMNITWFGIAFVAACFGFAYLTWCAGEAVLMLARSFWLANRKRRELAKPVFDTAFSNAVHKIAAYSEAAKSYSPEYEQRLEWVSKNICLRAMEGQIALSGIKDGILHVRLLPNELATYKLHIQSSYRQDNIYSLRLSTNPNKTVVSGMMVDMKQIKKIYSI